MEFRKMVMITLYAKQKKKHRCIEQTFGLCGRRRGWDVSREQHRNMYIIYGETVHQPRLDAWDKCSGLVHWEDPEGLGREGGGGGSGWGTHVNPRLIHVNVWQNPLQYCKVISLQQIKKKKLIKPVKKAHWKNTEIYFLLKITGLKTFKFRRHCEAKYSHTFLVQLLTTDAYTFNPGILLLDICTQIPNGEVYSYGPSSVLTKG